MRSVWLLSDCSDGEIRLVDSLCTGVDVAEGRTLVRQGDHRSQLFVSARGTAVASVDERPVALIEAGSFFGHVPLNGVGPSRATVTSATSMRLLVFSRHEVRQLLRASIPSVHEKIVAVLAERRRALAELALEPRAMTALDALQDLPVLHRAAI